VLIRLLRVWLRPYRGQVGLVVLLQGLQTLAALYLPTLNANIIDFGLSRGNADYIIRVGLLMLLFTLCQIALGLGAAWFTARATMAMVRDVRGAVFRRVLTFSAREMARFGTPSLITRSTNDVLQIEMFVLMACTMAVAVPVYCVGGIVMALRLDVPLSSLLLVVVVVLGVPVGLIVVRMRPAFELMQTNLDRITRVLREQIMGVRVVRAFVRDTDERARFGRANSDLLNVSLRSGRLMALMSSVVMLVLQLASVAVIWFGGHLIDSGSMQIGALTAYLTYLAQILMAVTMATNMFVVLPRAEISARRVVEVLDTEPGVRAPLHPVRPAAVRGHVELTGVEFRYPGAASPVLRDVSLHASPGETVAVIGSTGCGKSTLLSLIPRLVDPTAGTVRIDGVDVRDIDPTVLAHSVGMAQQRPYLFGGTVAGNLRYGNPHATDEELWQALDIAQSRDFVARMPDGLDEPITQGGTNVSGGQRQRLAIARMLVHRPAVYLFDDSFSALDHSTDAALRTALAAWTADVTVIVVAQRVSTIRDADRIVVLDEGRVVGTGTHHELVDGNEVYQRIVRSQATGQVAV
jgi:ATP-binding cassette subfamily B protein